MRVTVTNLSKGAVDLMGGNKVPANGTWTGEMDDLHISIFGASTVLTVEPADDPLQPFRDEYERLSGKPANKRWGEDRLFQEIEALDPQRV
jgi:hypothetical protein